MALNPSPQRQSVVTFPTPNVNDILFFETVDADRIGTEVPEYGTKHPDYKKWPDHRLVHVEAADDQNRYYRYYYVADQIEQDDDNWSYSEADIGGTKFDAVTRNYVIRRSEFSSTTPEMGSTMPDVPSGKFTGTHVLAERKQIPINDKILNGLYVIEQRTYVKKVPLTRFDFDEFFRTTNETKQILYYRGEVPDGASSAIEGLDSDDDYWGMDSGTVRTVQQLSDNWFAVTEQEVVKCESSGGQADLQDHMTSEVSSRLEGKDPSTAQDIFSSYTNVNNLQRNTNCWAHGLKGLTGFIAWNNRTGKEKQIGGVAITKRHILYAEHANYVVGDKVYFVTAHDVLIEREIIAVKNHPSSGYMSGDFGIGLLDRDLPASIEPVKVLPINAYQYFDTNNFSSTTSTSWDGQSDQILILKTDQENKALVSRLYYLQFEYFVDPTPDSFNAADEYGVFTIASPTNFSDWYEVTDYGDSGSPVAAVINGECVLLGVFTTLTEGGFVGAPRNYNDLNRMIADLDAEYSTASRFPADSDNSIPDYFPAGLQMEDIDLAYDFENYRPDSESTYAPNACARLRYETVVTYAFPPILSGVEFDVWNLRTGASKTYPRVLYTKGAFRGPCRAVVDISWATEQPVGASTGEKPEPEAIQIQNPLFTLNIPPTLHGAVNFTVSVNDDETLEDTGATYTKNATNVVSWKPHVISSEVKPFRGGWLMETVTVYPPS